MLHHEKYKRALDAARHFTAIGLVALPSKMDAKRPMIESYKQYRTNRVPSCVYDDDKWRTTNLQLMTGVETTGAIKILVVDLDGPDSHVAWKAICDKYKFTLKSRTHFPWVARTGSVGTHIYFQVPTGTVKVSSRLIWGLYDTLTGWVKHREIRVLGDCGLAIAPPSVRTDGAGSYAWHGQYNPRTIPLPEAAPAWLMALPAVLAPERHYQYQPETNNIQNFHGSSLRGVVLSAMMPIDKIGVAKSWGLRFASAFPKSSKDWIPCHAIGREDVVPSAGFDASTGVYHEFGGEGRSLSLFDLGVALGVFSDWKYAMASLHAKYVSNLPQR